MYIVADASSYSTAAEHTTSSTSAPEQRALGGGALGSGSGAMMYAAAASSARAIGIEVGTTGGTYTDSEQEERSWASGSSPLVSLTPSWPQV